MQKRIQKGSKQIYLYLIALINTNADENVMKNLIQPNTESANPVVFSTSLIISFVICLEVLDTFAS